MSNQLNYYKDTYQKCRETFFESFRGLNHGTVSFESIQVNKPEELLFTDFFHFKNHGENPLIIITSGLHGIEGFVGSALQVFLLDLIKSKKIDVAGLDLLFVHAINPWGFKNKRRVSKNNVDLNRNFSQTSELFKIKNRGYSQIRSLLEPDNKYSRLSISHSGFVCRIFYNIYKYSKSTLIQAIGEGQYEYEKGIIYGGKNFEEEKAHIQTALTKYCEAYKKILVIDLHTGLGKRGKLQLLNAPKVPESVKELVNKVFDDKIVDDSNNNFFKEHGSFLDFIWNMNKDKMCLPVMFEFGTRNSESTFGALRTLKTMINENQAYFYGCRTNKDKKYINRIFLEMFYPSDINWRKEVMKQFEEIIPFVFQRFKLI